jgi:hypothetical protein
MNGRGSKDWVCQFVIAHEDLKYIYHLGVGKEAGYKAIDSTFLEVIQQKYL